jgi:hypothetical protein
LRVRRLDLPASPSRYVRTFTLDGVEVRLHLQWIPRAAAWYADVSLADGSYVIRGERLTPGTGLLPNPRAPGMPGGRLVVLGGRDPYLQTMLGAELSVHYYTAAEVAALGIS